jgi:hypothetical protein
LAQPPDISETFLREVDENLRRDQIRDFFTDNKVWLIAALVLFLAASGGLIWFQQHRQDLAERHVEQLAQIYKDIGTGKTEKVAQQLDDLSDAHSKAVRATALFTRAAFAIQQEDQKLAIATYKRIVEDGSLPQPYRDAALIRQTALALVKQGKTKEAGQLFASIAKDKDVPQSLRDRSIQIAGSLGVDASAALAPQAK